MAPSDTPNILKSLVVDWLHFYNYFIALPFNCPSLVLFIIFSLIQRVSTLLGTPLYKSKVQNKAH